MFLWLTAFIEGGWQQLLFEGIFSLCWTYSGFATACFVQRCPPLLYYFWMLKLPDRPKYIGGWGIRFSISLSQTDQFSLEGLQVPPFFSPKSRNTLSGKHHREPKEHSVAEQELQEGLPPRRCFWPSASLQLLSQAGRQEVVGSPPGRHGKDAARGRSHSSTAKHRITLWKDRKGRYNLSRRKGAEGKGVEAGRVFSCVSAEAAAAGCNLVSSPFPTWPAQREPQLSLLQPAQPFHHKRSRLQNSLPSKKKKERKVFLKKPS